MKDHLAVCDALPSDFDLPALVDDFAVLEYFSVPNGLSRLVCNVPDCQLWYADKRRLADYIKRYAWCRSCNADNLLILPPSAYNPNSLKFELDSDSYT